MSNQHDFHIPGVRMGQNFPVCVHRAASAAGASAVVSLFSNFVIGISTKVAHPGKVAGNWDLDGFTFLER